MRSVMFGSLMVDVRVARFYGVFVLLEKQERDQIINKNFN